MPFELIARPASASPAVGLMFQHNLGLSEILDGVYGKQGAGSKEQRAGALVIAQEKGR